MQKLLEALNITYTMSNLQIGLAIAGGLVLAAVVAHSAWTARKNQPKLATVDTNQTNHTEQPGAPIDIGMPLNERQEPSFDAASGIDFDLDDVGTAQPENPHNFAAITRLTALEKKPLLDALIDVIAPVVVDSDVSGEAALAWMPSTRRAGSKPFGVEGLNSATRQWEVPVPGQRYSAFQCGVQLANRLGALNQIEYSEFVMKSQAFADGVGGEPEFPEMTEEVARAKELDQFASTHDAQLSFTLRTAGTAWSPGYVQQNAARLGFVAGSIPGRMVLPAVTQGGAPMLGLSFDTQAAMAEDPEQSALREVTLSLDVPHVPRSDRPFTCMCDAAIALATSMDGTIIDDNGSIIAAPAMQVVATELEQLYDTLDERELAAGSVLARRLFS